MIHSALYKSTNAGAILLTGALSLITLVASGCRTQVKLLSFDKPFGIQVSSKGHIFVSTPKTGVVVLDQRLKRVCVFKDLVFAHNVTETKQGTFLVADYQGSKVVEFTVEGKIIKT